MSNHEWLTCTEIARALRVNPSTVSERVRNRTRADAIPLHLISGAGHALRIHRSVAFPVTTTLTPLIPRLTDDERAAIADAAIERFVARLIDPLKRSA